MNAKAMAGMVPSFLPVNVAWVYLTEAALIAAVVAVIMGKKTQLALQLLGLMLLLFAILLWLPGAIGGSVSDINVFKGFCIGWGRMVLFEGSEKPDTFYNREKVLVIPDLKTG